MAIYGQVLLTQNLRWYPCSWLASEFPKQSGTVIFTGVVDEEGNATGVKQLVKSKIGVHYAVFGEPSGIDNITVAYKGRLALRLTCDVGESAHASAPWLAKNSIEEMYDFWKEIKSELVRGHRENNAKSISCSLTEITGGSSHNVTPQRCKVTIDIRVPTITTCDNVLRIIDDVITRVSAERGIKATYRIEDHTEPFEADPHITSCQSSSACRPRCAKQTTFAFAQDRHWWYERAWTQLQDTCYHIWTGWCTRLTYRRWTGEYRGVCGKHRSV